MQLYLGTSSLTNFMNEQCESERSLGSDSIMSVVQRLPSDTTAGGAMHALMSASQDKR